jgi:hypothetical protein
MKILYIHDAENWAIHNVGKLWLENNDFQVQFVDYNILKNLNIFLDFDYIFFGFSTLWLKTNYKEKNKIIAFHDPVEVFRTDLRLFENQKIIVTSKQVQDLLKFKNINSTLIPTTTLLDYRDEKEIILEDVKIISINSGDIRKNNDKLKKFFNFYDSDKNLKIGIDNLSNNTQYAKFLDENNIYICMSTYEGGPIPAFDAMARGCIVLSTKVGQIQELIVDNYNGFLLENENDFYEKVNWIKNNKDWLLYARKNALRTIKEKRNKIQIKQKIKEFLHEI